MNKKIFFLIFISLNLLEACYLEAIKNISYRDTLILNKNVKLSGVCNSENQVEWFNRNQTYSAKTYIKSKTFIHPRLIELKDESIKLYFGDSIKVEYYGKIVEQNENYIKIEDSNNKLKKINLNGIR